VVIRRKAVLHEQVNQRHMTSADGVEQRRVAVLRASASAVSGAPSDCGCGAAKHLVLAPNVHVLRSKQRL
jgi:hypothetical protein